jgi:hypothetical protein
MVRKILILLSILISTTAFAMGGTGASCNPNESGWGSCTLEPVPFAASVTNTINVSGGTFASAYIASQANTKYVLQGDVDANGTAITVTNNYIIIDLNGYTITYNKTVAGEGVNIGNWNKSYIAVVNGSIIQGAAMSEGDQYGRGNNPVSAQNTDLGGYRNAQYMFLANLYVTYGGRDVGGLKLPYCNYATIAECTVEDLYEFGTLKNRHQGIDAISAGRGSTFRDNTIIHCRHRGIWVKDDSVVYGNKISTRTIATNGYGIGGYAVQDCKVYSNTVTSRGEHPIGIGFVSSGTDNIEIYDNYLDSQTTAIGSEYGGNAGCFDDVAPHCGNFADGFRTTWGGDNINFHDNEIHIATNSNATGTYSPTGDTYKINAKGKGLFIGIMSGETATFKDNDITILDADGTGRAYGISCCYSFSDGLFILDNTVTTNMYNLVLSDEYGVCEGFPLIRGNTFIKSGSYSAYKTISNQLDGYFNTTGRISSNTYQDGASVDSIDFNPDGGGSVSVYFGSYSGGSDLYSYRKYDSGSSLLQEDFDPAITLSYAVPEGGIDTKVELSGGSQSITIGGGSHTLSIK